MTLERAFYQYEVLLVDEKVPLTAGKFLVDTILDTTFGHPVTTRMRTGFFPFVEPGLEIDVQCQACSGRSCRTCRQVGWLEIMPGGAPHPNVLLAGDLNPDRQGRPRSLRGLWLRPASQPGTALRGLPTTARSL